MPILVMMKRCLETCSSKQCKVHLGEGPQVPSLSLGSQEISGSRRSKKVMGATLAECMMGLEAKARSLLNLLLSCEDPLLQIWIQGLLN